MKTNGIPSQVNNIWNQAQSTFGAAQQVRQAVDKGGFSCGISEGINQVCKDKNNFIAKVLCGFNSSAIGQFLIKKMFHLSFNGQGDSVEITTDNLAAAVGQQGKLGDFLLQMFNGNKTEGGWLTNICSTVCTSCSNAASSLVGSLIEKIPNDDVKTCLKSILTKNDVSSKTYNREEQKKAREKECEEIKKRIKDLSIEELGEEISECEVSLREKDKDQLYIKWAQEHKDIGDGDKSNLFRKLSETAKENLGYNSDLNGQALTDSRKDAIKALFK